MENPKKEPELKKEMETQEEMQVPEQSLKEERIRRITLSYYFRSDVRKAMYEFSKNRECVPRYFEGFGKRPDAFQFDSDIIELAKNGATSFHCSEEIWSDPLELSTGQSPAELNKLRTGWDLLIDVDSKYLDYSKIYAEILIEVLNSVGIKNIGVKFSGSKGWHVIIPWKAFPESMSGKKTSEMFPEWPRLICQYLGSRIAEKLKNRVLELDIGKDVEADQIEKYCSKCNDTPVKKSTYIFQCPGCKTSSQLPGEVFEKKRKLSCSNCFKDLTLLKKEESEIKKEEFFFCEHCKISSKIHPEMFKDRVKAQHIAADLVLVSPRHLFRMPYSLHEKTALASIVIPAHKIKDFSPKDADPMKVIPVNFIPDSEPNEASLLLQKALEFKPKEENQSIKILQTKFDRDIEQIENNKDNPNQNRGTKKFSDFKIFNLTPDLYPPSIKKILEGMPSDGKKRALFILIAFFRSLKLSDEQIKFQIEEWNKKNKEPLSQNYINGQLVWYSRQKESRLPPNFDKSYYKDIGITPTPEELAAKNPVSYTIKKSFSKNYKSNPQNSSSSNQKWNKQKR